MAVGLGQVTVSTARVKWFIGQRDWRAVATKMGRDPSGLERAMRRDSLDFKLADAVLTFLKRPDAVSMLVRCVAHPCMVCGSPLTEGRCPECKPVFCSAGCGEHVLAAGVCGWCVEERELVAA